MNAVAPAGMVTAVYCDGTAETAAPYALVDAQLAAFASAAASGAVAPPFHVAATATFANAAEGETVTVLPETVAW